MSEELALRDNMTVSRKQRLRTLESEIRKAAEEIQRNGVAIGRHLCAIRDDQLWDEEYDSWSQYLKVKAVELVGKSFSQAARLIRAAEISKKIPQLSSIDGTELSPTHMDELARLAPNVSRGASRGVEKDYSQIRTQDVARVLKSAAEKAGSSAPSVTDLRKAVDEELGIDRAAKAKETQRQREESRPMIQQVIWDLTGHICGLTNQFKAVNDDGWTQLWKHSPNRIKDLIGACESLVELLRKAEPPDELQPNGTIKRLGIGVIRAHEAINILKVIPRQDALRQRGFEIVTTWIRNHL
jgi:hypothetical protein